MLSYKIISCDKIKNAMEAFDLAISYIWEYDVEFIEMIEEIFHNDGLSTFIISDYNVFEITERLRNRSLSFIAYLDRASDADENYNEIAQMLSRRKTKIFNPYKQIQTTIDKATMHLEFITAGINTPYTIIIPPLNKEKDVYVSIHDLARLGRPFIIKPANTTGGGLGVITGAESLEEALNERAYLADDKYLLQEKIYPTTLNGKRAWFRCFWAFGYSIPCWWDDQTHLYELLTAEQIKKYNLKELSSILRKIAKLTQLDFFSTEIVLTNCKKFIAVDYVNDQCDMRPQLNHWDGVPNDVIYKIIHNMKNKVKKMKKASS